MENENDIDQLFRRGLEEPEIPFNELDWEKMERKLDAQKPKRLIPVWMMYTASGIHHPYWDQSFWFLSIKFTFHFFPIQFIEGNFWFF